MTPRDGEHAIEAIGPEMSDAAGGDEHGDNQDNADGVRLKSTSPKAKSPVNTTPITVSSLMRLCCLMNPVPTAQPRPAMKASMSEMA